MPVKRYGTGPARLVLVHGGPGAAGSLEGMAKEYGTACGVLEPWQTARTVEGQVEELHRQLVENCREPVVLLGHSWGAWLVLLVAARYPERLKSAVLLSSGMLRESYVEELTRRRTAALSPELREEWERLNEELSRSHGTDLDEKLARLGSFPNADDYDVLEEETSCIPDGRMYQEIWPQAEAMRADGTLLREAKHIACPLFVIHGRQDPHPAEGVTQPLREEGIPFRLYLLDQCGHSPWKERHAKDELRRILLEEILGK